MIPKGARWFMSGDDARVMTRKFLLAKRLSPGTGLRSERGISARSDGSDSTGAQTPPRPQALDGD